MGKPIICPECQRIVVMDSANQVCPDCCGSILYDVTIPAPQHLVVQRQVKRTPMSEDLQWSLILIGIGILFLAWSVISPETSIKKKWLSGPGTPVSWIGGFCFTVGAIWAVCLACFSGKSN